MVSRETPYHRPALPEWLAPSREQLVDFATLLADVGVTRGLIGPREAPRLWERHLLNCAVVADPATGLVPPSATVADVGSGAGLPGIVWAIARPDLTVTLIEPLLRRSTFLAEAVETLGLADRVRVLRGRAEEIVGTPGWAPVSVVTARAVAPLTRLLGWTVPLLAPGGRLVALKGSSAADELVSARTQAEESGLANLHIVSVGEGIVDPPTTVIIGVLDTAQ